MVPDGEDDFVEMSLPADTGEEPLAVLLLALGNAPREVGSHL